MYQRASVGDSTPFDAALSDSGSLNSGFLGAVCHTGQVAASVFRKRSQMPLEEAVPSCLRGSAFCSTQPLSLTPTWSSGVSGTVVTGSVDFRRCMSSGGSEGHSQDPVSLPQAPAVTQLVSQLVSPPQGMLLHSSGTRCADPRGRALGCSPAPWHAHTCTY